MFVRKVFSFLSNVIARLYKEDSFMNKKYLNTVNPLVSIIVPYHDSEEFLYESLKSICKQTYSNLEIIIVDTSGSNKVNETVDCIKDSRFTILKLGIDKGLTAAFYEGFKLAKGEFIMRQDPDDTSSPDRIELQLNYLLDNPKLGMVSCLINCVTEEISYKSPCMFIQKLQNSSATEEDINNAILLDFIPILFPTLLIRKEILDKVEIPKTPRKFDDQIELLCNLIKVGGVEKIPTILYSYRRHKKAYHVIKDYEFQQHIKEAIRRTDLKNYINYKDFYNQVRASKSTEIKATKKSSLRVLMLVDSLNIGGTETHVLNLVRKLIEYGVYVVVGTKGGPLTNLFELYGIKVVNINISDYISNKEIFTVFDRVKQIIDKENINIIHSHLFGSMRIGSEISRRFNIPHVTTIHGLFYPRDILVKTLYNASSIITVSNPVKNYVRFNLGLTSTTQIKVIPNGVFVDDIQEKQNKKDIREELNIGKNDLIITYCSRLCWDKTNVAETLVFSFYNLASIFKYDNIHAIIIGDGDGKQIVQRESDMVNKILEKERIHVVGSKFNVDDYYLSSDIIIGTGRVALESMSYGKPVIAVGNCGYVGLVHDDKKDTQWDLYFGDHGCLKQTNVSDLTDDLKFLIDHPEKRTEIGQWSKNWCAEMFNIDKVTQEVLDVYNESINTSL